MPHRLFQPSVALSPLPLPLSFHPLKLSTSSCPPLSPPLFCVQPPLSLPFLHVLVVKHLQSLPLHSSLNHFYLQPSYSLQLLQSPGRDPLLPQLGIPAPSSEVLFPTAVWTAPALHPCSRGRNGLWSSLLSSAL